MNNPYPGNAEVKVICPDCGDCRRLEALKPEHDGKTIMSRCGKCMFTRDLDSQARYDAKMAHGSNTR